MRPVVAIMNGYNEEDVIGSSILDLINQGVKVHYLDDGSTDGTMEKVMALTSRFGPDRLEVGMTAQSQIKPKTFALRALLKEKEELAWKRYQGWWVMHVDADEYRRQPWPHLTFPQALARIEKEGYNACDHVYMECGPASKPYGPYDNLLEAMDQCSLDVKTPIKGGSLSHTKTWIQGPTKVNLASSGGHRLTFPAMRVWPKAFLLIHFPVRTQTQGAKKILKERLPIYSKDELAAAWHTHYRRFTSPQEVFENYSKEKDKSYSGDHLYERYQRLIGESETNQRAGGFYNQDPSSFVLGFRL